MNKKATLSTLALSVLLLTACQNDEETMQTDARVALQVTSGIQTRAYDATWEANDEIGIFGFTQGDAPTQAYSNVRYVTKSGNGTFTPDGTTIYLPTDDSYLDFVAYYPHTTSLKIVFNFTAGVGMDENELAGMKVQLTNQQTKALFDVTKPDGEVVVGTNTPATLTLNTTDDGTSSEGIVLPSENFNNMTLHLELADGGSFFNWDLNNSQNADKFEAGKKYVYDITVNRLGLGVTATITDWTPGNGENGEQGDAY